MHQHDHGHEGAHANGHGCGHGHAPDHNGRAFALGLGLNLAFVGIEAFYGWRVGSLALLADAGHNLGDAAGLLLAWVAYAAARLRPDDRHTYGWRRGSILAGFVNAIVLLVAMGWLLWEASARLVAPSAAPPASVVMGVAAAGVVVNGMTAWLFMAGGRRDLNLRGAFLHMAADALVSLGVVVGGALTWWRGWGWIDPAVSLVIAGVVAAGSAPLAWQALHLLLDGVPAGVDLGAARRVLLELPGVASVHDLHVWAVGTGGASDVVLTAHLVLNEGAPDPDAVLAAAATALRALGIGHTTLQVESAACGWGCGADLSPLTESGAPGCRRGQPGRQHR